MRFVTYKCDFPGCERLYTPSNGWYLAKRQGRWLIVGAWTQDEDLNTFEHYCGTEHFFKRISQLNGKDV